MGVSTPDNLVPFGAAVLAIGGLVVANRVRVARWNVRGLKDLPGPQSLKDATAAEATPVQMTHRPGVRRGMVRVPRGVA